MTLRPRTGLVDARLARDVDVAGASFAALRALKRQLCNVIWRHLLDDEAATVPVAPAA